VIVHALYYLWPKKRFLPETGTFYPFFGRNLLKNLLYYLDAAFVEQKFPPAFWHPSAFRRGAHVLARGIPPCFGGALSCVGAIHESPGYFLPRPSNPLPPVGAHIVRPGLPPTFRRRSTLRRGGSRTARKSQNAPRFLICAPIVVSSSPEAALRPRGPPLSPLRQKVGKERTRVGRSARPPLDSPQRRSRIHLPPGSTVSCCIGIVVRQNPRAPLLRGVQSTPTIAISLRYFTEDAEHTSKPTARPSEGGTCRASADGS
jgi:hypothetical protein